MPGPVIRKSHFLGTLLCVAGLSPRTFFARNGRNGLLAGRREPYSMADIAAVRTAVVLTGLGVGVQNSADAAMKVLPVFERLFASFRAGELDGSLTNIIAIMLIRLPHTNAETY
jgi:hypothetical protein